MNENNNDTKFYTAKFDRTFKEIFLKESNKDLLIKLLENVLHVEINNLFYQNIERNQGNIKVRRKYLDCLLETDQGLIGIELNSSYKDYLHSRNMAFLCDIYAHYTLVSEEYSESIKVIQINFSYDIGNKDSKLFRKYLFQDEDLVLYVQNLICYDFNMDMIMKFWYSKDEKMINEYKYLIMLDLEPNDLKHLSNDRLVGKFMSDLEKLNEDPKFREYMSKEEDTRKCHNTELRIAREAGITEGIAEGIEQGIEKGIIQGTKAANIETAKNLLEMGIGTIEEIAKATKLSAEEIEKLRKEFS